MIDLILYNIDIIYINIPLEYHKRLFNSIYVDIDMIS